MTSFISAVGRLASNLQQRGPHRPVHSHGLLFAVVAGSSLTSASVADFTFEVTQEIPSTGELVPYELLLADMDLDGDLDLVFANSDVAATAAGIHRNDGTGHFGPFESAGIPQQRGFGIDVADLNGDEWPDIAIALNSGGQSLQVLLNDGGAFSSGATYWPMGDAWDVVSADYDNDGDLDLLVSGDHSFGTSLFSNDGDGSFAVDTMLPTTSRPYRMVAADFDMDGCSDMAALGYSASIVQVFSGTCSTAFGPVTSIGVAAAPRWLAAADLDGDGFTELLTASRGSGALGVSVLPNYSGTFGTAITHPAGYVATSILADDFDLDGENELVVRGEERMTLFEHVEGFDFAALSEFALAGGYAVSSITSGDIDNDGWPDLVVTGGPIGMIVFRNTTAPPCSDPDGNGTVDIADLLLVLAQWGPCPPECLGDVNDDDTVDVADLLAVLAAWGPCPD